MLCKKEHFLKKFYVPSNLGILIWGKLTFPGFQPMQDHVLLHLLGLAVELKKRKERNLDRGACIFSFSLYQDVFSCANICIVTHSL